MPQTYRVKLSDGREFDVTTEGGAPSEADILGSLKDGPPSTTKPVSESEPGTYWGGVGKSLKEQAPALARSALNALPGVGAMVGGMLSTPETLGVGTVPGMALGAGAGRGARDLIGHWTGLDAPSTPLEKAGNITGETALTGATAAILPGAVAAVKAPIQTLREGAEQFGSAMPPAVRRLARILPVAKQEAGPLLTRPAWQTWPRQEPIDLTHPVPAGSLTQEEIARRVAAVKQAGGLPPQAEPMPKIRGMLRTAPPPQTPEPEAMPESWKPFADTQPHPLDPMRKNVGAEVTGRAANMTKQEVRDVATPIVGEAQGDASPILPEQPLQRIIDTLRAMPPGGPEREAYVARATSGKARGQIENIRRVLEHLGLIVPIAAAGGLTVRDRVMERLRGGSLASDGSSQPRP